MGRDITKLHPDLQKKITKLKELCKKNGIRIGIAECLRTVAEQDALYAKGRTAPGPIVTNAKGSTYSSMHMWGIAFDFYLIMDVDKDGSTSDDAYNNSTKLFNKVGKLGKSIGLVWGGDFKSITDLPHFQLAGYGDTPSSVLKKKYKNPNEFIKTWSKKAAGTSKSTGVVSAASSKKSACKGAYKTTANLRLRKSPASGSIIITIPKGKKVSCKGYYTKLNGANWYFVYYGKYSGYVSAEYLKKV